MKVKFYGNGIIWDKDKNRILCQFEYPLKVAEVVDKETGKFIGASMVDRDGTPLPGEYITSDEREIKILHEKGLKYENLEDLEEQKRKDDEFKAKLDALEIKKDVVVDDPNTMSIKQLKTALDEVNAKYKNSSTKKELIEIYNKNVIG